MSIERSCLVCLVCACSALAGNPELLINAQGMAQQDLSIRGSSYGGAGMSINGINLKVPYSAHFNTELPMYGPLLSEATVQTGLANVSGHLVGTSAFSVHPLEQQSAVNAGIGTEERYSGSVLSSTGNLEAYIDGEAAHGIDYDANDMNRLSANAQAQWNRGDWQFDVIGAGQHKEYGAQGYYGIPSGIYAEEETDDTLLLASAVKGDVGSTFMRAGASLRGFNSQYDIPSTNYTSDVQSLYGSVMFEGRTLEIQNIALNVRGDMEHERLNGDVGTHDRTRGSILILPEIRFERFTVKVGMNSVFQTGESAEWLPQAGFDFFATDNTMLYVAYAETAEQPDFRALYYLDPYHIPNNGLQLQQSRSTELGLHQFLSANLDWRAAIFNRRQNSAMDWTKASSTDTSWTATDLGTLDVNGLDVAANYLASDRLGLQLYYQWIVKDEYDFYAGLYELDYPEHLFAMFGYWQVSPEFQLFGTQTLRYQYGNNVRSSNDFGAEMSLGLHYDPRFANNVRLSFLVENLWDTDFQAIPGLKPRPISVSTGITVAW